MPLQTPYCAIVGALHDYNLVNPDTGQWPHYHVRVSANGAVFDSAINLKSLTDVKIEYRRRTFAADDANFASVVALPDGLQVLAQSSTSGALDYVRHPGITGTSGWILENGSNLIAEIQALLSGVQRLYIFGASYSTHDGVHDVHMNQGDPDGSSFQALDGIWQDGAVLCQYGGVQPRLEILQIKFETQSLHTDDHGLPVPFILPKLPIYYYIPRWRWPPGDPLKDGERKLLVESGLFELADWAASIAVLRGEAHDALVKELHAQVAKRLPHSSKEHVAHAAEYVVKLGQHLRHVAR